MNSIFIKKSFCARVTADRTTMVLSGGALPSSSQVLAFIPPPFIDLPRFRLLLFRQLVEAPALLWLPVAVSLANFA